MFYYYVDFLKEMRIESDCMFSDRFRSCINSI